MNPYAMVASGSGMNVPLLRERQKDIPPLAHDSVRRAATRAEKDVVSALVAVDAEAAGGPLTPAHRSALGASLSAERGGGPRVCRTAAFGGPRHPAAAGVGATISLPASFQPSNPSR